MAKYSYYIAKSLLSVSSPGEEISFHLRIAQDPADNTAPFLDYDSEQEKTVQVDRIVDGDIINYTVTVWLMETNIPKPLIYKDYVFSEAFSNFDKIFGKIIAHVRTEDGETQTDETAKDLVYDPMPAEYPVDQDKK